MTESVLPFLKERYGFTNRHSLSFKTFGLKESEVNDAVNSIEYIDDGITWGITADSGNMSVTIVSNDERPLPKDEILREVKIRLGDAMLGEGFSSPVDELVFLLKTRGLTISTAESCTGGLIAKMITDIPGSSSVFTGSVVAYSNEIKKGMLGSTGSDH